MPPKVDEFAPDLGKEVIKLEVMAPDESFFKLPKTWLWQDILNLFFSMICVTVSQVASFNTGLIDEDFFSSDDEVQGKIAVMAESDDDQPNNEILQ